MTPADAYQRVYERICTLVSEEVANVDVPTCPGWTVKDVIAHLAGFFTAYRLGDPKEAFGPDWGDREVRTRADSSLEECIIEWGKLLKDPGDIFESRLAPVAVSDVLAHEQDIRNALNRPGGRDDENIVPSAEMALSFADNNMKKEGLSALRVVTDDIDRRVGEGDPIATLRTSTFDLFRVVHGRRTADQVRAMEWDGDPEPSLSALFIFGPTEREVESSSV